MLPNNASASNPQTGVTPHPQSGETPPNTQAQPGAQPQQNTPQTFETFLASQPEEVQRLYQEHSTGLLNTVKATRQERDDLSKQIKELLPKVEKGSATEAALNEMQLRLEAAEGKAKFLEEAVRPGVDCRNPKAAYALAVASELFDRRGNPDWTALKAEAPELFGKITAPANAGSGTSNPPKQADMNMWIRRSSGRG